MIFSTGICLNSCVPARPADTNAAPKNQARVRQFLHHFIKLFFPAVGFKQPRYNMFMQPNA
ncbi:hypothetical protein Hanom_Chr16g01478611 [Helianthus anomalus]